MVESFFTSPPDILSVKEIKQPVFQTRVIRHVVLTEEFLQNAVATECLCVGLYAQMCSPVCGCTRARVHILHPA